MQQRAGVIDHTVVPDHVPPELVRPFPYILGHKTTAHPHSFIEEIHRGPEIFWAEKVFSGYRGAWVPRRAEDLQQIYLDNEHFTVRGFAPFSNLVGDSWYLVPAEVDPPDHGPLRAMVNPLFTPKRMAVLEDKIRMYARDYVEGFRARGGCEFLADFAFEFPIKVFMELMGLPQEQTALFMGWEHKLLHEPDLEEIKKATRAVVAYLRQEMADRRVNPRDDLITFGVQAEVNGRGLTDDELVGFCFNLFIGGLDTVSTNMALQFRHLAEHPEHQALLRAHPEMIPDAIEELMRAYAAVATSRECIKETTIRGVTIQRGDKVQMSTFLAARDPAMYANPNEVILDRKPRHVSFGSGVHLCVGMHLARREMRIAMDEFLARIPPFSVPQGTTVISYLAAMIQPIELPLVWS
jgi:cytochrome P450